MLVFGAAFSSVACDGSASRAAKQDATGTRRGVAGAGGPPGGQAGMRVYIDPATGEITSSPPPGAQPLPPPGDGEPSRRAPQTRPGAHGGVIAEPGDHLKQY